MSLGKDPQASRFLHGTLKLRPAACTRVLTWDLAIILQGLSLAPFEPLEEVPAKFLTLKVVILLAISSLKRIGDLQALSVAPLGLEFAPGMVKAFLHPRPECFMVGMVFLGLYSSFFFLQTRRVVFIPKSYILVSSDHMTFSHASSGSFRWSLANFRRAWTCAGLSRGTLRTLQDFNPWQCSVLLMVTVETVVPALFRSLTRSSRVVLGWSLTFLRIVDTPRGEILHGAPVRGRLTVILNFFNFLIIVPTVVAFSPSCLLIVL